MTIEDLRDKQIAYQKYLPGIRKLLKEEEANRKKFVARYSKENLQSLPIEDYVCGTQKDANFCNWLERGLRKLGSIVGSTSFKFGVYYGVVKGDDEHKYRFKKKWGNTYQESYQKVRATIISLLEDGEKENLQGIKNNALAPMLKGKILNIYYPEKYLSIFSEDHLNYYLSDFNIPLLQDYHVIEKRALLIGIKNKDAVMSKWTNYEFSYFLYNQLGRPDKKEVSEDLKPYLPKEFPPLKKVKPVFIHKHLDDLPPPDPKSKNPSKKGVIDFDKKNKQNARIGEVGEHIVLKKEREVLLEAGRKDLADQIIHTSKEETSAGYDIYSFSIDGTPKRIEVKSTIGKPTAITFYLSANELQKSIELDNYYIYLVFEVDTIDPKILCFESPFQEENPRIRMEPKSYAVRMRLRD